MTHDVYKFINYDEECVHACMHGCVPVCVCAETNFIAQASLKLTIFSKLTSNNSRAPTSLMIGLQMFVNMYNYDIIKFVMQ